MGGRLRPYGREAATLWEGGCNPMGGRLQPYDVLGACSSKWARSLCWCASKEARAPSTWRQG